MFLAFNLDMPTAGLSALQWAFVFIGAAAAFDFWDGMSARLLHAYSPIGMALLIAVMGALRLGKFNVDTRQTTSFIGLPIPANAIFWVGTLAWISAHGYPGDAVMAVLIVVISLLMVSEIKMFSLKFANLSLRENVRRYVIIAATALFVITDGVSGFAWTIVLYILISVLGKRTDPSAAEK